MHDGLAVAVHRVGEVEPAVINVLLLAVGHGVHLHWLGQLVPAVHLGEVEVGALLRTRVLLLSFVERSALNTFSKTAIGTLSMDQDGLCLEHFTAKLMARLL